MSNASSTAVLGLRDAVARFRWDPKLCQRDAFSYNSSKKGEPPASNHGHDDPGGIFHPWMCNAEDADVERQD
jgi:hypothetical protein